MLYKDKQLNLGFKQSRRHTTLHKKNTIKISNLNKPKEIKNTYSKKLNIQDYLQYQYYLSIFNTHYKHFRSLYNEFIPIKYFDHYNDLMIGLLTFVKV